MVLSKAWFVIRHSSIPPMIEREMTELMWKLVWDNQQRQCSRDVAMLSIKHGGLAVPNLKIMKMALNIFCIKKP